MKHLKPVNLKARGRMCWISGRCGISRIYLEKHSLDGRVDQDHTYCAVNISGDGHEIYLGVRCRRL